MLDKTRLLFRKKGDGQVKHSTFSTAFTHAGLVWCILPGLAACKQTVSIVELIFNPTGFLHPDSRSVSCLHIAVLAGVEEERWFRSLPAVTWVSRGARWLGIFYNLFLADATWSLLLASLFLRVSWDTVPNREGNMSLFLALSLLSSHSTDIRPKTILSPVHFPPIIGPPFTFTMICSIGEQCFFIYI